MFAPGGAPAPRHAEEGMSGEDGLVYAYVLDGAGGGRRVEWPDVRAWRPGNGALWVHVDRGSAQVQEWLANESGLEPLIVRALIAEETRPRSAVTPAGLLVILRGANLNPGAQPEDLVSLRTWVDAERVITVRRRRLKAVLDVQASIEAGAGPQGAGGLLVALMERLTERLMPVVERLHAAIDHLEVAALEAAGEETRSELAAARRRTIALRRYITPQRDAIVSLCGAHTPLIGDQERLRLRECADRVTRYVEDLDALRERAAVANDELHTRLAETMNRRMYILSLVAAVFLPLGLITGLLGVNVGGIPLRDSNLGFWIVTGLLVALGVVAVVLLRRHRLF
jgi:zinc transporter